MTFKLQLEDAWETVLVTSVVLSGPHEGRPYKSPETALSNIWKKNSEHFLVGLVPRGCPRTSKARYPDSQTILARYRPDLGHLGTDIGPNSAYDIGPISGISALCRTEIADIGPI